MKSGKSRGGVCSLPVLLLIGAFQFIVICYPTADRYMMMLTNTKPGFPSFFQDGKKGFKQFVEFIPEPHVACDFSDARSDVCEMDGSIRIRGSTSEVFVVTPRRHVGVRSQDKSTTTGHDVNTTTWNIRPYTRKGEARIMPSITEMSVKIVSADEAPRCTVEHGAAAVVYSNGGYCGNYYHDFNDNIIPLFITSRHFDGEVQLLVTQKQKWWFEKYKRIVAGLTNYEAVDLDKDDQVHCYRRAVVGLRSHRDLSIDPRRAPNNYSMVDFKKLLIQSYALPREYAIRTSEEPSKKPRLLIISRKARRRFVNLDAITAMATTVGFDVTTTDMLTKDNNVQGIVAEAAAMVNSFDVLMAVHGSGLTNSVFLPMNAVVVQVVPLGRLEELSMWEYGLPPRDMNMRYLQYNITEEESTLIDLYPRAHPVFLDPLPIHRQSWSLVNDIYLGQQNVRLNITRFRPVLQQVLELLR